MKLQSNFTNGPRSEREILDVVFPAVRAAVLRLLSQILAKEHYVRELVRKLDLLSGRSSTSSEY